ncbi:hypothetical protein J7L48_00695 [bacterium]|nr:hypothetical protein [bacterium]
MQFIAFESGIEVNGQTVYSIVDALGSFKKLAHEILLPSGIGNMTKNGYEIKMDEWYSQTSWLRAFEMIAKEIGEATLKRIGTKIPENAKFPPWVKDIDSAIKSIDIAYHMNHRKNGTIMFDPDTGKMLEGIGHYGYERIENENMIISKCKNPYPDSFDLGIITAMAKRFELKANIYHDDSKECRKNGGESCTYIITW